MKELSKLSIEEKAKLYDDAIINGSRLWECGEITKENYEYIFCELKESEDERIKRILHSISSKMSFHIHDIFTDEEFQCFDTWSNIWLEKQGENNIGISEATKKKLEDNLNKALEKETPESCNEFLEKQEHDNTEPKYKVGVWFVCDGYEPEQIIDIRTNAYEMSNGDICPFHMIDNNHNIRIWTIQDAKDGDVLACESGWTCIFKTLDNHTNTFSSYCFMDKSKWFCNTGSKCHTLDKAFIKAYNGKIHPATKYQQDLLFQKMKEAGYEWNAEKKELKKIITPIFHIGDRVRYKGHACDGVITEITNTDYICGKSKLPISTQDKLELVEWKPTWGKEDSPYYDDICEILINLLHSETTDVNKDAVQKDLDWLISLKPQATWKPSKEQMEILQYLCETSSRPNEKVIPTLESLYQDLKKLREE